MKSVGQCRRQICAINPEFIDFFLLFMIGKKKNAWEVKETEREREREGPSQSITSGHDGVLANSLLLVS